MKYKVSIDPGTNATGVCVWEDGKIVDGGLITIRPKDSAETFLEKCLSIVRSFTAVCECIFQGEINCLALEEFETHNRSDDEAGVLKAKMSMIKCATIRGALIGSSVSFCKEIRLVSKRQISKADTKLLAKSYGLVVNEKGEHKKGACSKDALDAFQIGICAGFDKRS